jgi:arsenate reductase (glutaredoxin)
MKAVTLWHNPRCSKSRQALELLRERGVEPEVVEYLKDPPGAQELGRVLKLLGMEPRDLMRKKEPPYRELGLANASLGRDALIAAMVEHPILIERPVVIAGSRAVLARPPDLALALLD